MKFKHRIRNVAIFAAFISLLFTMACNKSESSNDPEPTGEGSIEWKVNGKYVKKDNDSTDMLVARCEKIPPNYSLPQTNYVFVATANNLNSFVFRIISDSLVPQSFHFDSAYVRDHDNFMLTADDGDSTYMIIYNSDYLDVNITSYKNRRISGTFSGKMTKVPTSGYSSRGNVVVTEGKINSVPVIYY